MTKCEILSVVEEIMICDGPDGHIDGSRIIAEFIGALLDGHGEEWFDRYMKQPGKSSRVL